MDGIEKLMQIFSKVLQLLYAITVCQDVPGMVVGWRETSTP